MPEHGHGFPTAGHRYGTCCATDEIYLYVCVGFFLPYFRICDISDPANPVEIGVSNGTVGNAITVAGLYAYVAAGNTGMTVVDISDPYNPIEMGNPVS